MELPGLDILIDSQLDNLSNEHQVIFFQSETHKKDLKNLKEDLQYLTKFDIDSTELILFHQEIHTCGSLRKRVWYNEAFTLTIADFETIIGSDHIKLINIKIDSKDDKVELFTTPNAPLEYLIINDKHYQPGYESRIVVLDEAIENFEREQCP
ncbi:MAG: hypothetical protein AAGI38_19955 [Bacteroidota bacterium]